MKVVLFILVLLLLTTAIYANPWSAVILSELWFGSNGHLYVELAAMAYIQNYNQVQIAHGDTIVQLTQDIPITGTPLVIDIMEQCPQLTFNPDGDSLIVYYFMLGGYIPMDGVKWGYGEHDDVYPPLAGQSLVQTHHNYLDQFYPYPYWCKDEPPTPASSPYWPIARDTLTISVINQNGQPVPNVPLCMSYYNFMACGTTDSNGIFYDILKAGKQPVIARHPITNDIIHEGIIDLEPNQATQYQIVLYNTENDDYSILIAAKGLKAYPNPFNNSASSTISFNYDGDAKLSKTNYIRIYDTKGRFIKQIEMDSKGTASWQPSGDTASGLYVARLISSNRIVDTATFTILK